MASNLTKTIISTSLATSLLLAFGQIVRNSVSDAFVNEDASQLTLPVNDDYSVLVSPDVKPVTIEAEPYNFSRIRFFVTSTPENGFSFSIPPKSSDLYTYKDVTLPDFLLSGDTLGNIFGRACGILESYTPPEAPFWLSSAARENLQDRKTSVTYLLETYCH